MFLNIHNKKTKKIIMVVMAVLLMAVTTLEIKHAVDVAAAVSWEATLQNFPSSYHASLTALHNAHPTWKFVAMKTREDWNVSLGNEMYLFRNLVPNTSMYLSGVDTGGWYATPTSWKETDMYGSYNWEENKWVTTSGGSWVQASESAVKYVMDPRNWLTENNIFAFEQLSYDEEYQTYTVIRSVIDNTFMDYDYGVRVQGSGGKTYATVLRDAAQTYNVSPIHLASRIIQEKGSGQLNNATGQKELTDTLACGVATDDGGVTFRAATAGDKTVYYNFFNIGAAGTTAAQVINSGGKKAMESGWTSQYLSIMGGAQFIASGYINAGQDTLYAQKFNVVDGRYWHQYMQNLLAPVNEGYKVRTAYINNNLLNINFTFKIPVFDNMPASACKRPDPLKDTSNPNYKLGSISVVGTYYDERKENLVMTPTFSTDDTNYTIVVPYKLYEVDITATAYAATTLVTGTGKHALNVGSNIFKVKATAQNGTVREYTINIQREEGSTLITSLKPSLGTFDKTFEPESTQTYTWYVPYNKNSINLSYTTQSSIAAVVVNKAGSSAKRLCSDNTITLSTIAVGSNTYYIDVFPNSDTNDRTDVRRYTINVIRYANTTFDLSKYQVTGYTYTYNLEDRYINGFEIGQTVTDFTNSIGLSNGTVTVISQNGKLKSGSDPIGTGDTITIKDKNGLAMYTMRAVVYGDVNCDGLVNIIDFAYMKSYILRGIEFDGLGAIAAKIDDRSNDIGIYDIAAIKSYILRKVPIEQYK